MLNASLALFQTLLFSYFFPSSAVTSVKLKGTLTVRSAPSVHTQEMQLSGRGRWFTAVARKIVSCFPSFNILKASKLPNFHHPRKYSVFLRNSSVVLAFAYKECLLHIKSGETVYCLGQPFKIRVFFCI